MGNSELLSWFRITFRINYLHYSDFNKKLASRFFILILFYCHPTENDIDGDVFTSLDNGHLEQLSLGQRLKLFRYITSLSAAVDKPVETVPENFEQSGGPFSCEENQIEGFVVAESNQSTLDNLQTVALGDGNWNLDEESVPSPSSRLPEKVYSIKFIYISCTTLNHSILSLGFDF
jgi:hypothetical protein